MKKILTPIVLALVLIIGSCSNNDSPRAVAEKYLNALGDNDFETAKKYGTVDTDKLLDIMIGFSKMIPDSGRTEKSFTILDEKIDGDKATVIYKEEGESGELSLSMLRVNGKWEVNMTKESINEAEGGNTMDIGATLTDTVQTK